MALKVSSFFYVCFFEWSSFKSSECHLNVLLPALLHVWTVSSGFCFVTFSEHTNAVTALHFMGNNHCLLSASLDGTVCAWDLFRYQNFRTFTTPSSRQFVSLAADQSDEVICAGTLDSFEVLTHITDGFCSHLLSSVIYPDSLLHVHMHRYLFGQWRQVACLMSLVDMKVLYMDWCFPLQMWVIFW